MKRTWLISSGQFYWIYIHISTCLVKLLDTSSIKKQFYVFLIRHEIYEYNSLIQPNPFELGMKLLNSTMFGWIEKITLTRFMLTLNFLNKIEDVVDCSATRLQVPLPEFIKFWRALFGSELCLFNFKRQADKGLQFISTTLYIIANIHT